MGYLQIWVSFQSQGISFAIKNYILLWNIFCKAMNQDIYRNLIQDKYSIWFSTVQYFAGVNIRYIAIYYLSAQSAQSGQCTYIYALIHMTKIYKRQCICQYANHAISICQDDQMHVHNTYMSVSENILRISAGAKLRFPEQPKPAPPNTCNRIWQGTGHGWRYPNIVSRYNMSLRLCVTTTPLHLEMTNACSWLNMII